MAATPMVIRLGGDFGSVLVGARGRIAVGPLLPDDVIDGIYCYLRTASGTGTKNSVNLRCSAFGAAPASDADFDAAQAIIIPATSIPFRSQLITGAGNTLVHELIGDFIPVYFRVSQTTRFIAIDISPDTVDTVGAMFLKVFRREPE